MLVKALNAQSLDLAKLDAAVHAFEDKRTRGLLEDDDYGNADSVVEEEIRRRGPPLCAKSPRPFRGEG